MLIFFGQLSDQMEPLPEAACFRIVVVQSGAALGGCLSPSSSSAETRRGAIVVFVIRDGAPCGPGGFGELDLR